MKNTNELKDYYKNMSLTELEVNLRCDISDLTNSSSHTGEETQKRLKHKIMLQENELKTRKGVRVYNFNLFGFNINIA